MKPTLLYIDGFNYFYRAFAKDKASVNEKGEPIGGVITFMRQLFSTMDKLKPSHVLICWDGEGAGERRRSIFKDYKDRRGRRKERIINTDYQEFKNEDEQLKLLFDLLGQFPFMMCKIDYLEADDVIQYLASKNQESYNQIICSTDRDYYQVINENISVWSAQRKVLITKNNFNEFYDFLPENFIYYKLIFGDDGDNVKGVNGFGDSTILKHLPELKEQLIDGMDSFFKLIDNKEGKSKTLSKLKESKDLLVRNFSLMSLNEGNIKEKSRQKIKEQLEMQYGYQQSLLIVSAYLQRKRYNLFFKDFSYINNVLRGVNTKFKLEV